MTTKIWKDDDLLGKRYRLMRQLGRDRGTLLWEAHDDEEMKLVHIRILQDHLRSEPLVEMRFRREADLANRLDHRALLAPHELIDDDGVLALVYEIPGTATLTDRLRQGVLEPVEAVNLLEPILVGLEFAHRRGVIHRNLSPDHIWLDESGGARLGGFGGAKVLDMVGLTTQSMAFGLSHYRAPEQWFSQGGQESDSDPRTDVWALGVMLFEMIVGSPPVAAGGPKAMLDGFESLDLDKDLGELASPSINNAIAGALVVERRERISSVRALSDVLLGLTEVIENTTALGGLACWNCDHPRVETLDFCLRCGEGYLVRDPGAGSVDVVVPKFRRGREKGNQRRFAGWRSPKDFFFRTFHPQLDAEEKALLSERLRRAGAVFDEESEKRLAYSPFRIASELTWPDAYRLMTFLEDGRYGELRSDSKDRFENPTELLPEDSLPVLFFDHSEQKRSDKLAWSMKGVSWSSPALYALLGLGSVISAGIAILALLFLLVFLVSAAFYIQFDEFLISAVGLVFFLVFVAVFVAPIWIALGWTISKNRRPAVSFQKPSVRSFPKEKRHLWTSLTADLANERDRRLVEEVMATLTSRYNEGAPELLEEIRADVELLGYAPRDTEWQRLQVAWEGLEAKQSQGSQSSSGERKALAEEMKRHEKAMEQSELARARIFEFLEGIRSLDSSHSERKSPRPTGLRSDLEELRILHQSLIDLEGRPTLEVMEAAREEVDLQLELPERFDVIRLIASGGMANVVLAYDHYRDEQVALKVVLPQLRSLPQINALMRQEFEAARKVRHPGLVGIHEHLEVDGVDVLVMDYIEGIDLKTMIRWRDALPPAEIRRIGMEILDALEVAHRSGVIHGDIKPANILIGADDRVVLVDFGLARMEYLARDEQLEARLGTPGYVAPEILEGGLVDERADIFGLGLTLHEALTGKLPFGADGNEVIPGHDLQEVEAEFRFRNTLKKAAARDSAMRFRSAQDMKFALHPDADISDQNNQTTSAAAESCHNCGTTRLRHLHRCAACGVRRYQIIARSRLNGFQVIVDGHRSMPDMRQSLSGENIAAIRQIIAEFQRIQTTPHFEESLADLPVLLTPSIDKKDAKILGRTLHREGFLVRTLNAQVDAPFYRVRRSLRRILASSIPLLALIPIYVFTALYAHGTAPGSADLGDTLMPISLFFLGIVIVVQTILTATELRPVLRSATTVEKGARTDHQSAPIPPWEDRAIEALQKVRSERTRSLIEELVTAIAELRESWLETPEFSDLVDQLDKIAIKAFEQVDSLIDAEEIVAGVSPLERTTRHEEAHFRVVRIGSALLSLARKMRDFDITEIAHHPEAIGEMEIILDFDSADDDDIGAQSTQEQVSEAHQEVEI